MHAFAHETAMKRHRDLRRGESCSMAKGARPSTDNDQNVMSKADGTHIQPSKVTGSNLSFASPDMRRCCSEVLTDLPKMETMQQAIPKAEKFISPEVERAQPATTRSVGPRRRRSNGIPININRTIVATGDADATISVKAAELKINATLLAATEMANPMEIGAIINQNSLSVGTP